MEKEREIETNTRVVLDETVANQSGAKKACERGVGGKASTMKKTPVE